MFNLVLVSRLDVAMATNCRREIGRNRRHAFLLGNRVRQRMAGTAEPIGAKFTRKTCLVLRSDEFEYQGQRSKVKVTMDKNALCTYNTSPCERNGTPSLQMTSRKQQTLLFDRCRGVSSPVCMRWLGLAGYCWALPRIFSC